MIDLNLDQALSKETIQRIHYFAEDTLEDIFRHIDRLKINNENSTGQLRDSIRATVYTNASGNMALVKFFYLYYGECVEQAVGGYYGVDQDLREKGMGLKSPNVGAPPIGGRSYTASDGIIKGVDKNASLDSVVGGFLGIGNRDGEVKNGKIPEGMKADYALKAMALTAADVKSATANGNKYTVVINDCSNPQKDGKNAISRATNDFFTHQEVVDGLAETAGSLIKVNSTDVKYTAITITATVDGDALKTLNISYTFAANLSLKALGAGINGKGKATNSITYTIG